MKSNHNIQIIQKLYADFNAGDMEAVMGGIAENATWAIIGDPDKVPISGSFKGHAEIIGLFKRVFEVLDIGQNTPSVLYGEGNQITGRGVLTAKVRANGAPFESPHADLFQMEGGKVTSFIRFLDSLALYEAVNA